MPITYGTPVAQNPVAGAKLLDLNIHDIEGAATVTIIYQEYDSAATPNPIGQPKRAITTLGAMGITPVQLGNRLLAALGVAGTAT